MKRKRKIIQFLLVFCLVMAAGTTVWAEKLNGNDDWKVEFTPEKAMVCYFTTSSFDDVLDYMQPGDSAEFSVTIHNSNDAVTDWYMANQVLKSLEDASKTASGGAYSYILTYTNAQGKAETLYNSETIGGENYAPNLEGLHEATDALDSFFYLDTLERGKSGAVQLYVQLDGETQGNDYQDTLAQIQMNFAVELPTVTERHTSVSRVEERQMADRIVTRRDDDVYVDRTTTQRSSSPASTLTRTVRRIVRTGDETNLTLLLVCAGILGLLLLIIGILSMKLRKKLDNKSTGTMLLAVAVLISSVASVPSVQVQAADDYAYTVRIFSGAQGTFADGSTQIVMKAAPDTTLDFTRVIDGVTMLAGKDAAGNTVESKYYAKGIRESGKDNNTAGTLVGPVHRVTRDIDLVIAYAMKGGDVEYTVQYLKADTKEELLPSEHFYGNVGDKPVVAYKYIDGYIPQAYNLAKTLKEDATQNVFTFLYTDNENAGYYYYETDGGIRYVDKDGETIVDHIPGMTIYQEGQESSSQEQTDAEPSYNVIVIPAEEETARNTDRQGNDNDNGNDNNTGNTDDSVEIPDAAAPLELVDLDDEVAPLASGIGGLLGIDEEPGARVLYLGTVITAGFLLGLIILMLCLYRRASAQAGGKKQAKEGRKGFRRRNKG